MADEGVNNIERFEEGTTVVLVWDGLRSEMVEIVVPINRYTYRGEQGEIIPREATHITVGEGVTFVRARAFRSHRYIIEVICHDNVEKIEQWAFSRCFSLRRVIMPGVKIVEDRAFSLCKALTDVECGKLEIVGDKSFIKCSSLRIINLSSVRIVGGAAFSECCALKDVKYGNKLERFEEYAFNNCFLERITIPLKDDLITEDNVFQGCYQLKKVDLLESAELQEIIAALHLEGWRNDMSEAIASINRSLPATYAKGRVIRTWVRSVLQKIIQYQEEHQRILDEEVAPTLQFALPQDIVTKSVFPFLQLPPHTFGVEEDQDEEEHEAESDNNVGGYIYRGEEGEIIRREATHITVGEGVTFVRARAFRDHPNIIEVICNDNVEKIEELAFHNCWRSLRRVIMPGVKIVERCAFWNCEALTDVECGQLEIIGQFAFTSCILLKSINLLSVRIVGSAFAHCAALTTVKFGSKLERIEESAFCNCPSLERITIPLKDGLITDDNTFQGCESLNHVDLIEGELHETIAALQLEEWRNDMNEAIHSINRNLPDAGAGYYNHEGGQDDGEKARVIRTWVRSILSKIIQYQAEHRHLLGEVATTLEHALPRKIVANNVLPFLELPPHTFEVEVDEDEEEHDASYSEGEESEREEDNSDDEQERDDDDHA